MSTRASRPAARRRASQIAEAPAGGASQAPEHPIRGEGNREDRGKVYDALKEMPRVAGTVVREDSIRSFYETMGGTLLLFTFVWLPM